ncbi:MAG TPA: cupin domain-containing protein [Candidatus Omnitrophota bacterium]|nr:cupin domain-containing protein [Candidatus Omnitrophota bacterium]HPS36839.1 cupin domain-containing protein [Candidatus Omnitrophota bacterium]
MELETVKHIAPAFVDARGEIINVFEGTTGHVAYITSKKGSVRANHYHKKDVQYMYLISGAYDSYSCDIKDPSKKQVLKVKAGDIVATPPLVAHAQKFTEDSVFLSLTTREREDGKYEEDTLAYPVIEGYLNKELKTK